jgi:hypothetical protein
MDPKQNLFYLSIPTRSFYLLWSMKYSRCLISAEE